MGEDRHTEIDSYEKKGERHIKREKEREREREREKRTERGG